MTAAKLLHDLRATKQIRTTNHHLAYTVHRLFGQIGLDTTMVSDRHGHTVELAPMNLAMAEVAAAGTTHRKRKTAHGCNR